MLNYIWGGMILIAVIFGTLTGRGQDVSDAALSGAGEAVTLCISMLGVMALWTGVMRIAEKSGLNRKFLKLVEPALRFLFPEVPKESPANKYIASNMLANILGLGWAATPFGLKAMQELQKQNIVDGGDPHTASRAMCTFLILNISSLQLIPVNIIAYRSQYGSVNPAAIVVPAIITTLTSTVAAVIFVRLAGRGKRRSR